MPKKLLFNFNREAIQNYTYVKYVGAIITATNTLEKPIKSAILKGSTKYRDIDTGEVLDAFEDGRNLELVSVRMPVLQTCDGNIMRLSPSQHTTNNVTIEKISDVEYIFKQGSRHGMGGWKWQIPNSEKFTISFDYEKVSGCENQCQVSVSCAGGIADKADLTGQFGYFEKTYYVKRTTPTFIEFKPVGEITSTKSVLKISNLKWYIGNKVYSDKTNILSCLEPVELGSVGEVKDELNLLTQQLTQRTETRPYQEGDELNSEFVSDMTNTRYKLSQEVVKTVDLSILDQNENKVSSISSFNDTTHITASSETIPPIFEGYLATKEVE